MNDLISRKALLAEYDRVHIGEPGKARKLIEDAPAVEAVVLPYRPRPMLKSRNPWNMDVYCPECGANQSGYYGEDPLPVVTCFECGEILDPYKTTTGTDGEREYNG